MPRIARILVGVAALAMSAAYVLPLWRIELIAPQYPEGLGMLITVDDIEGFKPGDLQSINGLNHYIGMKTIEPESIPELRIMPFILGALIVSGVGVAVAGRRRPLVIWAAVVALTFGAGLADYWKWGYEYGHDLSPTAIIKVPGMTYQPPLIGSKKLLNFTATSWPATGGWILVGSALMTAAALWLTLARRRVVATVGTVSLAAAAACGATGPRPMVIGEDICEHCRMAIADLRFGGQVILATGRILTFDSIECLAAWTRSSPEENLRGTYVIDVQHPGTFVRAEDAAFLESSVLRSPMGRGLIAFVSATAADEQRTILGGGDVLTWKDVLADVVVDHKGPVSTISEGITRARPGDRIVVRPGTYREPTIVVRTPGVVIEGDGWPVLDGEGKQSVLVVEADDVVIRGLVITNTGTSHIEDRAGIRVRNARGCLVEGNRVDDALFGIYLERTASCTVRENVVTAHGTSEAQSGNGIHIWQSNATVVEGNHVSGHRDGIYFEFSPGAVVRGNTSEHSRRYGMHFMYSDSGQYERNVFRDNAAGIAVMYSRGVTMVRNRFEGSIGPAAYGLLMKDISGGEIARNRFVRNSTGMFLEGSTRLEVRDNDFEQNGWATRVLANADDNRFTGNRFVGNAFDVTTNSRSATSTFDGNWWDAYRGYDLDRDGIGDVPFHPVRLFALVVERHPATLSLLRSPFVAILDATERVLPVVTPAALVDRRPLMRSPR